MIHRWPLFCTALLTLFIALPAAAHYPSLATPVDMETTSSGDVAVIVAVENYVFLPDVRGTLANAND